MSESPTDAALIAESAGRPERFGEIFDRHYRSIHQFAARRLGSAGADDVAAETFARAFRSRKGFNPQSVTALPWLYGIATNVMRMHKRKELRRLRAYSRTGIDPAEDFAGAATERASADASRRALLGALAELGRRDREIVMLTAWTELNSAQIGEALGIPGATVRTRLARARTRLAQTPELMTEPLATDVVVKEIQ